jgi:hypothetical protein
MDCTFFFRRASSRARSPRFTGSVFTIRIETEVEPKIDQVVRNCHPEPPHSTEKYSRISNSIQFYFFYRHLEAFTLYSTTTFFFISTFTHHEWRQGFDKKGDSPSPGRWAVGYGIRERCQNGTQKKRQSEGTSVLRGGWIYSTGHSLHSSAPKQPLPRPEAGDPPVLSFAEQPCYESATLGTHSRREPLPPLSWSAPRGSRA